MQEYSNNDIAVFGGSFDPPHIGHVFIVKYLVDVFGFKKVFVIPCGNHSLKDNSVSFEHRYKMCKNAFSKIDEAEVLDIEKDSGISYTIDTINNISKVVDENIKLHLVIGEDLVGQIKIWKQSEELLKIVNVIVIPRRGISKNKDIVYPIIEVSSSDIRKSIRSNDSYCRMALPKSVYDYIIKHNLFGVCKIC